MLRILLSDDKFLVEHLGPRRDRGIWCNNRSRQWCAVHYKLLPAGSFGELINHTRPTASDGFDPLRDRCSTIKNFTPFSFCSIDPPASAMSRSPKSWARTERAPA